MNYSIDIYNTEEDFTITLKNLSLEILQEITKEESIEIIFANKYYLYGVYDKCDLLSYKFMILKSTKKSVVLLRM